MIKKGIILAGGLGTRMSPLTKAVNKQLLPIHDKPMIFYPLSVMMLANIKKILMIVNPGQINNFKSLLGDGSRYGIEISYKIQIIPKWLHIRIDLGISITGKISDIPVAKRNDRAGQIDLFKVTALFQSTCQCEQCFTGSGCSGNGCQKDLRIH